MSDITRRKSLKKSRQLLKVEKEKVILRLREVYQFRDKIVDFAVKNSDEAEAVAKELLDETDKSKFFLKYVAVTDRINKCYTNLLRLFHSIEDDDDDDDDSSSGSIPESLNSMIEDISPIKPSKLNIPGKSEDPRAAGDSQNENGVKSFTNVTLSSINEDLIDLTSNLQISTQDQLKNSIFSLESVDTVIESKPQASNFFNNIEKVKSSNLFNNDEKVSTEIKTPETKCDSISIGTTKKIVNPDHEHDSLSSAVNSSSSNSSNQNESRESIEIHPLKLVIGNEVDVYVSSVNNPLDFWVNFLGDNYDTSNLEYALKRRCTSQKALKIGKELTKGLFCCAWNQAEEMWCRVQVTRIQYGEKQEGSPLCPLFIVNSVEVRFLDSGLTSTLHPDNLRDISEEIASYPAMATRCSLARIRPPEESWPEVTLSIFKTMVLKQTFVMTVVNYLDDGMAVVELDHTENSTKIKNVSDYLLKYKHAVDSATENSKSKKVTGFNLNFSQKSFVEVSLNESSSVKNSIFPLLTTRREETNNERENIPRCSDPFTWWAMIPIPELPKDPKFQIFIDRVNSPSCFFAQIFTEEKVKEYNFIRKKLDRLKNDYDVRIRPPLKSAVVNNSCWAARNSYDKFWYRVRVISNEKKELDESETVFVYFVDYGEKCWIKIDDLRPLLTELTKIPDLILKFCLALIAPPIGESDWSYDSVQVFTSVVENCDVFKVQVIAQEIIDNETVLSVMLFDCKDEDETKSINSYLVDLQLARSLIQNGNESITETCDRSTSESDNENTAENDANAEFENWNPLSNDFNSETNFYGMNTEDPVVDTTGLSADQMKNICMKYNSRFGCRDPYCKYPHEFLNEVNLCKEVVVVKGKSVIDDLTKEMVLFATVSSVFDPGHFYVVLPFGARDIRELKANDHFYERELRNSEDIRTWKTRLNEFYNTQRPRQNPNILYAEGQLVAVKVRETWFRARILTLNEEERIARVVCLDYGASEEVHEMDMSPLVPEFVEFPFQAVECFLFNVEPIGGEKSWSKASRDWFENRLNRKFIVAKIESKDVNAIYVNVYETNCMPNNLLNDTLIEMGFAKKANPNIQYNVSKKRAIYPG